MCVKFKSKESKKLGAITFFSFKSAKTTEKYFYTVSFRINKYGGFKKFLLQETIF